MSCLSRCVFYSLSPRFVFSFFFFNDTATTEIYTLSLHDALPILLSNRPVTEAAGTAGIRIDHVTDRGRVRIREQDRKSTRLNSSHRCISYAVFCLKKKKKNRHDQKK